MTVHYIQQVAKYNDRGGFIFVKDFRALADYPENQNKIFGPVVRYTWMKVNNMKS